MSVKYQKKNRISSALRDYQNSHEVNTQYQVINCYNNKLQLHKKLIEAYAIHLVAVWYQKTIKTQTNKQDKIKKNHQRNSQQFTLQIQGTNLYVTKSLVKHTFALNNYLNENIQFLRFQIPQQDAFAIQSYSFSSPLTKTGFKVSLVSHQIGLCSSTNKFTTIKPLDLIEENMRIRAMKLSQSNSKSFTFESQSTKTLNLKWNTEASHQSPSKKIVDQIRNRRENSIGNVSQKLFIQGVQYKKSMQKLERDHSRSFNKVQKHIDIKNNGAMKILQRSKNNQNKSKLNVSMSSKILNNSLCMDRKRQGSFAFIYSKKCSIQNVQDQISSESYYTAKKGLDKQIQIPQRIQPKKFIQTTSKQNMKQMDTRTSSKKFSKLGSTLNQLRHTRQSQSNNFSSMNSSINLQGKKFNKNICQAKIAQISRTLLTDDKNTLNTHNINLSRNQK